MVGNSIEVIEAIETLKGRGPESFRNFCFDLVSELLVETKVTKTKEEALQLVKSKIESGEALDKLKQMISYQHGNPNVIDDYTLFPQASNKVPVKAPQEGFIKNLNALEIGISAMMLGAGRESKDDIIDLAVGVELVKKVGDQVKEGDTLAYLHSNGKNEKQAYDRVLSSYEIVTEKVEKTDIIIEVIK